MTTPLKLEINPSLEIKMVPVTERHHCAVVDDFLLNPELIVDYAANQAAAFETPERAYPGRVLPLAEYVVAPVNQFIRSELSRLFSFCRGGIAFHTQLSITTLQPSEFTWIQRLCHTDPKLEDGRRNFAALLYLFKKPELGGTGFYRWKDEDFWSAMSAQQQDDPDAGLELLEERFEMFREPARYMTESNEAAELLDHVPARFNRLVFYSGELPHSAFIRHPELLSADPREGRLTLNCFASVIPKS